MVKQYNIKPQNDREDSYIHMKFGQDPRGKSKDDRNYSESITDHKQDKYVLRERQYCGDADYNSSCTAYHYRWITKPTSHFSFTFFDLSL